MKAVRIHELGEANVLHLEETPRPEPREGEVLIKVHAASVNPIDYKIRSGSFKRGEIKLPTTLGRDVSGIVEAVGRGVVGINLGQAVYAFLASRSGGYAEYAIATSEEVAPKPSTLNDVSAAAVPLAAMTAWQALFDHGDLQAGQRVLIHGGAGGVGHFAIQFAKVKGAFVVTTGRSDDLSLLGDLGADVAIDYKAERFEDRTGEVDLVIDLIGGETLKRSWAVLKTGGTIVSTVEPPSTEEAAKHQAKGKVFMAEANREELTEIGRLIDQGKVRVVVQSTLPLERVQKAHEQMEHEHIRGKVVLTVGCDR